jgi:type IV fimbrial biogenesis protein FimT
MVSSVRPRVSRTGAKRGFTLIELMVTLAVVAIFSTLAAPSFSQLIAQQRLKTAASALSESLWIARSEALKRNGNVSFTFTTAAAGWNIIDSTSTTLFQQDGFSSVTSTIKTGTGILTFSPYGRLTATGAGQIQLSNSAADVYSCVTISTTGRTSVKAVAC